ncbi:GNAT family N-acetyltransferase [soil metagenome]
MTAVEPYAARLATPEDDPAIGTLVVEGFLDQFVPVFGHSRERSDRIMTKWVELEHASGGVQSLVIESDRKVVGSVGVRAGESHESILSRGLWRNLQRNLGLMRALWATMLLSYPRYTARSTEAYVERLVVTEQCRNQGMGRELLLRAETLGRRSGKETVGLHVSGNNQPAIQLYIDEGYVEVSRQRSIMSGYFLGIQEWLYMKKVL